MTRAHRCLTIAVAATLLTPAAWPQECGPWERFEVEIRAQELTAVAAGNGAFVAVGLGQIIGSSDGVKWHNIPCADWPSPCSGIPWLVDVAFNGTRFVGVGGELSRNVFVIDPEAGWTALMAPGHYGASYWAVAANGSAFLAAGRFSSAYSPDGLNWTSCAGAYRNVTGLCWDGTSFVSVGSEGIATTTDCSEWTLQLWDQSRAFDLADVASNGEVTIAVGRRTSFRSTDGVEWTEIDDDVLTGAFAIDWTGSRWLASNPAGLWSSSEGVFW
jgi:hypothetical protein